MEYDNTPEPLYVSDIGIPKTSDILPCPDCGQERSFEFQVKTLFEWYWKNVNTATLLTRYALSLSL